MKMQWPHMVSRPDWVKVGPLWYCVEWRDKEWVSDSGLVGQCKSETQVLIVADCLSVERTAATFVHEVTHALMQCIVAGRDQYSLEEVADYSGFGMVQFWQDNPAAFDWWISLVKQSGVSREG